MKKLFFLTALLCASLMANATAVYTGTPFSGSLEGYTYNIEYTITYNDDHSLTFTAEFTGTFTETPGLVFEVWSSDLSTGNFKSFVKGEGNTWSVTDNKDFSSKEEQSLNQLRLRIASQKGGTDQLFISAYTVGLDNTTPVTPDSENPVMGDASLVSVAGNYAIINVAAEDNIGVTKYHVVDASKSFNALFTPKNNQITVTGLAGGTTYNFTITAKDAAGNESTNHAEVEATTTAYYTEPQAAAKDPTLDKSNVLSLYSNKYTTAGAWGYLEGWGQSTTLTTLTIGENDILHYNNFNYLGWQGTPVNATSMEKVHLDIWVADNASIRFFPIYGGAGLTTDDSHYKELSLTGQIWNSFDLTLATEFAGLDLSSIFQVKFDQGPTEFFVDNVYFFKDTTTAIDNTEVEAKAIKVIENGQLFIIKNGVRYNALGVEVR